MFELWLLDFETKSGTDIKRGYDQYFQDPDADLLCMVDGHWDARKPNEWWPGCGWDPVDLFEWVEAGGMVGASNAAFDQSAWEYLGEQYGFPIIRADQWFCTQAQSRIAGMPSKLIDAARAAHVKHQKGREGTALIQKMSIAPFEHTPQLLRKMVKYCAGDWYSMRDVCKALPLMPQHLFEDYQTNEIVNGHGIRIDRRMAAAAAQYADTEKAEIGAELEQVTGGLMDKPTQYARFKKWLKDELEADDCDEAVAMMVRYKRNKKTKEVEKKYSTDKTVRANMLADPIALGLNADVVKALGFMDDASGAATSKYAKMCELASPDDDRVRGIIRAFGAPSTLRYSSLGLQVHNFKRDTFELEEFYRYRGQMLRGETLTDYETGEPVRVIDTLGKMLRGAIVPAPGHAFVVGDWSAVESMMTALLSGEQRKLDVFKRGECPYEYAAEGVFGHVVTKKDNPQERQVGKVVDLACGFLGGPGALAAMASQYKIHIEEDKRESMVKAWRGRHPRTVAYGDLLLKMATRAMKRPRRWFEAGKVAYLFDGSALYCRLPDEKTVLRYPEARLEMVFAPWDPEHKRAKIPQITALKAAFTMAQDDDDWPRHALWRGLLLENVVQASCAILLRDMVYMFRDICTFHVHDELVLEVLIEEAERIAAELKREMAVAPWWCLGLPLKAEPVVMPRYGKPD